MNNTSNTPLISVIIPVYNAEKYLCKCVNSILSQTYANLEIILVDDGSTDQSGQMCDAYTKQDDRVQVIHQKNGGISVARNTAIKVARGSYISFVDSDDCIAPDFIEILWKLAVKHQALIAVVGQCVFYPTTAQYNLPLPLSKQEDVIISPCDNFNKQQALHMTFDAYGYFVTDKLFDASLFKRTLFPEELGYEDVWILFRLFQQVNKVAVLNEPLYFINRRNENSVSHGRFNSYMLDYFKVTDEFLKVAQELKDTSLIRFFQRQRLGHICGFFKRMMLSDFNDQHVIKPMQQELRRNLWILLLRPRPLRVTAFGCICAIRFQMAKKILGILYKQAY